MGKGAVVSAGNSSASRAANSGNGVSSARRRTAQSASRRSQPSERKQSASASAINARLGSGRARSAIWANPRARAAISASAHSFAEAVHLPEAQPERERAVFARFQRVVPFAETHIDGAHFDIMLARIAHDLGRRIETHRLRIEQRTAERGGMMALEPGRDIDKLRKARGMAFRKAIGAEAFDLLEAAFGEIAVIAARDHVAHHLVGEGVDRAQMPERRHCASQPVRFVGREFRRHDGKLHRLLLEQRHAVRLGRAPGPIRLPVHAPAKATDIPRFPLPLRRRR